MIYYIYKIVCNDVSITDFYIGSTSNIRHRKCEHKYSCNNENRKSFNFKIYQIIRHNGGWNNWRMIVLEEMVEGTTLLQSRMREENYRLELQSTLNTRNCGTGLTKKEYEKEYSKTEKYKEYQKKYNKEYEQTDKRKEYLREYQREYSKNNRDKINERRRENYNLKKEQGL